MYTKVALVPSLLHDTAWFAPFPPANVRPASSFSMAIMVSPSSGNFSIGIITSALTEPTTTTVFPASIAVRMEMHAIKMIVNHCWHV